MSGLQDIPELAALNAPSGVIRIPPEIDIPLTPRLRQLIDTREFRRLAHISQLGLVSLVYPAANHTRFEHSLGVFRNALFFLNRLARDPRFEAVVRPPDAELFLLAALFHDLGHWPFCHPIEDMKLPEVPSHELFANSFLLEGEIADSVRDDWGVSPRDIVSLLSEKPRTTKTRVLDSMLSGPIDIDKIDYLFRDSLHAGVPYGRNFDQNRLIGSLCLNEAGDGMAITEKGKTAAEMMVFSRYVMFSEVYWHHAVRAATAMLQRAFYLLYRSIDLDAVFRLTEHAWIVEIMRIAEGHPARELLDGLFGPTRRLYKQVGQYSFFEHRELYQQLARKPYTWLVTLAEQFATVAGPALGRIVAPHEILFDAPPMQCEIQFDVDVFYPKENRYRPLSDVSPVCRALAEQQFDDYVKRVRLFAHPRVADDLRALPNLAALIEQAVRRTE
jgi:HD superfamily phosphohydrolase